MITKKTKPTKPLSTSAKILKDLDKVVDQMVEVKIPHQDRYGRETIQFGEAEEGKLLGKVEERRVHYEGEWYIFKGVKGKKDILEKIPIEVLKAEQDARDAEEEAQIKAKGHDCNDFVCHGLYDRGNGSMNDYYYCGKCNELLQTG